MIDLKKQNVLLLSFFVICALAGCTTESGENQEIRKTQEQKSGDIENEGNRETGKQNRAQK